MRLSISQPALAATVARGAAAAAKNSPMPILNYLRLVAEPDGTLSLASSDQDRFAEAKIAADVTNPGAVCIETAAFTTLIGKHPKTGTITLDVDGDRLIVSCGRSKVKLPTLNADTFPKWADEEPDARFTMAAKDFFRAFGRVRFAASSDATRYYLNGVHLDYRDTSLHFVATDGHRLAISGVAALAGSENCPKVIVPVEGVDAALKVFKDAGSVDIAVGVKAISFATDGLRLSSRLIDGNFPDYTRVIPERGNPSVSFDRGDFVDCLDRASVFVGDGEMSSIKMSPDAGTLRLEARSHSGGEATEELAAKVDPAFEPMGFNPKYCADFLRTLTVGALTIEQRGPRDAHLILSDDAPDFLGVLMPVNVA